MFIWKHNQKRCNPYAAFIDGQGTRYNRVPPSLYDEIPDPARGDDAIEYTQELDVPPYVIITSKSPEQLERLQDDKDAASAKQHLLDTDYLFFIDRHDKLKGDGVQREAELRTSREAAREVLRAHKIKYPPQL